MGLRKSEKSVLLEGYAEGKRKHTGGLEPTISCSVGKRLIQLGYACLFDCFSEDYTTAGTRSEEEGTKRFWFQERCLKR